MDSKPKDLFGYENQQANYDIYRPKYPPEYFDRILSKIPLNNRMNFLDLATGTGSVLFPLSQHFSNLSLGIDISDKQIETALKKIDPNSKKNIQLKKMDIKDVSDYMALNKLEKFDLITIGEALHWFDVPFALKNIKENWLKENGMLSILAYICIGLKYNVKDLEKRKLGNEKYYQFYDVVKSYFECDREEIKNGYKNYPFDKFFTSKEMEEDYIETEMTTNELIKYVKTFSAYNTYYEKNHQAKDFKDVTLTLLENIHMDLKKFEKDEFVKMDKPVILVSYFFLINLKNK